MNVREEDKRKTSNTTRGLATAAIGLGIGAALYYFLSKGSPHPDSEGATSSGWTHERVFRERPWTLEECSICFDVMLRDQEIMTLACTHNFHAQCIMPWLQEKQTCPNCRKHAD